MLLALGTRPGTAVTVENKRGPGSFTVTPFSLLCCQEGDGSDSPSAAACSAPSLHRLRAEKAENSGDLLTHLL